MKLSLYVAVLLFVLTGSVAAERKQLVAVSRQIEPGKSDVVVNPGRPDSHFIQKNNEVRFDSTTGLYTYTYWRLRDGTKVDVLYEPSNRVDVVVTCSVNYDEDAEEYIYKYRVQNKSSSLQSLRNFIIDSDPRLVLRTEVSGTWHYYSGYERPPGSPIWTHFGSAGGDTRPGSDVYLTVISKYGPGIAMCYAGGRARRFEHPDGSIDALAVYPPTKEGVKGKTIAPTQVAVQNEDLDEYLRETMEDALEWGWTDTTTYAEIVQMLEAEEEPSKVLEFFRDLAGVRPLEPEIEALVSDLERKQLH